MTFNTVLKRGHDQRAMLFEFQVLLLFYMTYGSVLCCVLWENEVAMETKTRVLYHPIQQAQVVICSS